MKTTFLYGKLENQLYMHQPERFAVKGKENHVCLLKKYLYGLKQSPRQWYKRFNSFIVVQEFSKSKYDICILEKVR